MQMMLVKRDGEQLRKRTFFFPCGIQRSANLSSALDDDDALKEQKFNRTTWFIFSWKAGGRGGVRWVVNVVGKERGSERDRVIRRKD